MREGRLVHVDITLLVEGKVSECNSDPPLLQVLTSKHVPCVPERDVHLEGEIMSGAVPWTVHMLIGQVRLAGYYWQNHLRGYI